MSDVDLRTAAFESLLNIMADISVKPRVRALAARSILLSLHEELPRTPAQVMHVHGRNGGDQTESNKDHLNVKPHSITVQAGSTQQFTAPTSQPPITWSLTGVGSISPTGLYTAPLTSGTAVIRATSGSVFGTANVTVTVSAPTVAVPAAATPNPVAGNSTALTVLGADAAGESTLTYSWSVTPPTGVQAPTFSANGTNAAKNTTATFFGGGVYSFTVTIRDAGGLTVTSSVSVTVNREVASIAVLPQNQTVAEGASLQFSAVVKDQFNVPL